MKKKVLFSMLLILYLLMDYYGYYYGLSKGILSEKLPSKYYIDYGTYNINDPSISIMEKEMNLFLISKGKNIMINNREIKILKLIGYYFNSEDIIVKIMDSKGVEYNIGIVYPKYSFIYCDNIDKSRYKYINLNHSEKYYIYHVYIKMVLLIGLITLFMVFIYRIFIYYV